MRQILWLSYQVAVASAVYVLVRDGNPDLSASGAAVIGAFAAFVATALPLAVIDLAVRLRGWAGRRAAKKRPRNRLPVGRDL